MRTSVSPNGFVYGIHKPSYSVRNLRSKTSVKKLGTDQNGTTITNAINYPESDIEVSEADWIYEIANPLSFRGTTFIGKNWADKSADNYERIALASKEDISLSAILKKHHSDITFTDSLPRPLLLSLATTSTDPDDLVRLAGLCCSFETTESGDIVGLKYARDAIGLRPQISDHALFEAVANNPALPDHFKTAMVIRPGAQGASEIVGDYHDGNKTHIYEYLRRNSYIGGGHYAANMAEDAIRYSIDQLSTADMLGLRHLYYQRTYQRLAADLDLDTDSGSNTAEALEVIRRKIIQAMQDRAPAASATLWGWNFGFDYAPSDYRLHASHQQVHQQYALVPQKIEQFTNGIPDSNCQLRPFSSGDMVTEVIDAYQLLYRRDFFVDYLQAITINKRMDGRDDRESSLVIWEDDNVLLFVPKAQTSQWEVQLMTKPKPDGMWPGNILETDSATRCSIDTALLKAQKCLAARGARMVTSIEYSKRLTAKKVRQPLIYCLMPKLPQSPGAFSETQLRFINGHYPEDFAAVCRLSLNQTTQKTG